MTFLQRDGHPNMVLHAEDFYISFNPGNHPTALAELCAVVLGRSNHKIETALCKNNKFYILDGDFRKEYEELALKGWEACLSFFRDNIDKISEWSSIPPPTYGEREFEKSAGYRDGNDIKKELDQ